MVQLTINGTHEVDAEPDTPLLWVIREQLGLTGTKYGCGIAQCGACTVHIDGVAVRSCSLPVSARDGGSEDRHHRGPVARRHRIRCRRPGSSSTCRNAATASRARSWPRRRCCQDKPKPTDDEIDAAMTNICRCGTYNRIRAAIKLPPRRQPRLTREDSHDTIAQDSPAAASSPAPPPPAGGLVARLPRSVRRRRRSRGRRTPEINAWVVIKPDDTVVIRIARVEMGQGTLTGLAQLVAEELECDWSKVTTEYPTPGQNLARKRVWGDFSDRRQPRHPQLARVRPQGRRRRAHDADPGRRQRVEGAGVASCTVDEGRDHAQAARAARPPTARWREAAAKLEPPKDVQLKDPKDWKIAGKPLKRLDTADKLNGKQVYAST